MYKLMVLFSVVALAAAKPSVVAPVTYSASGVAPAVSSVSQYRSRVVHGSSVIAPAVYSASVVAPAVSRTVVPAVAPAVVPAVAPAVVSAVTALFQIPHFPAVVLDAVNGVPLDTSEVVAARAAHFHAKTLSGVYHLGKRSVVAPVVRSAVVAPVASVVRSAVIGTPVVSTYSAPAVVSSLRYPLSASVAYSAVVPNAISVRAW